MGSTLDAHTAEQKARELLESRITSVRSLVTKRAALDDLRAQIAAAEAEDVKAYRAALNDGWSADELRKLGIDEPAKQTRARRRSGPRKEPAPASSPSSDTTSPNGQP